MWRRNALIAFSFISGHLDTDELRDYVEEMLRVIALDLDTPECA
jgi:hypothetical protein